MDTVPSSGTSSSSSPSFSSSYFPQFNEFHEDIRKLIISFVADAPFEKNIRRWTSRNSADIRLRGVLPDNKKTGSITHVLPLVNKEFYTFTKLDYFWEPILKRQLSHRRLNHEYSRAWKEGLHRLLSDEELTAVHNTVDDYRMTNVTVAVSDDMVEKYKQTVVTSGLSDATVRVIIDTYKEAIGGGSDDIVEKYKQIIFDAGLSDATVGVMVQDCKHAKHIHETEMFERTTTLRTIVDRSRRQTTSYKTIYKTVCTTQLHFEAPMFIMPCTLKLGELYGLHLFEPRYRIMMHDLLHEKCADPVRAGQGKTPIVARRDPTTGILNPPFLLHACFTQTIDVGKRVCLVQLAWSKIYEDGTADVRLLPVAFVEIDQISIRREAGDLYYAKVFRNLKY